MEFAWDARKAEVNRRKHGVSFDEVCTAFFDPLARVQADPDHSESEDRFVLLGMSDRLRVLVVVHCCRQSEQEIRIISARKANRMEKRQYEEFLR